MATCRIPFSWSHSASSCRSPVIVPKRGFVYVQSTTTLVHNSHRILLLRHLAEDVGSVESPSRAPRPISLLPDLGQRQTIPGTTVTSRSNYITGWLSPQPLQVEYDLHAARWLS